ncbi:hypothetical protein CK203_064512 [Vitis vinifera]|uniref:Leucine-rich repeat-containing N-terminal plant-type domain-containing protein n=1 Tax=Vitis vinifera TaxID=29760 RepID=A0A438G7T6_VITVI|nr:hypothetical protein CK203_064512 [Vitis vinifera]
MRSAVVILLWFLFQGNTEVSFCAGNPSRVICRGREKRALLSFRSHVDDPSNRLSSWTGEECCVWDRVGCDNITGHVVKLNLRFCWSIPTQLGNLSNLQHLDIKGNSLNVEDLEWVGNLTSLQVLDISGVNIRKAANWLEVMNKLPSLSLLHLSGCGLDTIAPLPAC